MKIDPKCRSVHSCLTASKQPHAHCAVLGGIKIVKQDTIKDCAEAFTALDSQKRG
jgi:hypothetical protein